jgi:hypothetical protein
MAVFCVPVVKVGMLIVTLIASVPIIEARPLPVSWAVTRTYFCPEELVPDPVRTQLGAVVSLDVGVVVRVAVGVDVRVTVGVFVFVPVTDGTLVGVLEAVGVRVAEEVALNVDVFVGVTVGE